MKVLHIGKYYPPVFGGIERATFDIVEELNKRDIKTDVICFNSKNKYVEDEFNNYKVFRVKTNFILASAPISFQIFIKLKQIVESGNYDILHFHHPNPIANLALFFCNLKNKKLVVHWHSDIIKQKILLKFYKPFQNWLLKKADIIIGTSPNYIKHSEHLKKFKNKCIAIPFGIKKLEVNSKKVKEIKTYYKNKKIIFALGRYVSYKGFKYLIEAGKYLNENTIILIGGDGPLRNFYEKLIKKLSLQNRVKLVGNIPQEELGSYYEACDIFCLPSVEKNEAFGLVLLEAMSFGKPIVATNILGSGVPWVNQHGITGINVEPRDPKALAEAINIILNNKEMYKKFSQNALKRYKNEFTLEKEIEKIIKLYLKLISF
ncbi:glycosyl transferase family 1 [Candidatus Pacearchaeota archaeon]|nr:MAG: glycosyl transferase family 1 [Candidatus Pacearchaeota archaeon]